MSKCYKQRQAEWIEANGIKVGDRVRVIREAKDFEDGWDNEWVDGMSCGEHAVSGFGSRYGIQLDRGYNYPYFVLEKLSQSVDDPRPSFDRTFHHPGSRDSYTGSVLIIRYNGLETPTACVVVDLGDTIAFGIDIINWYVKSRDVEPEGLGVMRLPQTILFNR